MRAITCQQKTAEWLTLRSGRISASRLGDVIAKPKRGTEELARRRDYRMELLCERLTGRAAEHYVSRDMDHGVENEPYARAAYEISESVMVDEIGMAIHPTMDFASASPDGLVGDDGCIEIKCPRTATHLEWKMAGVVPEEHIPQMMWVMACCERKWADFISFDPRLPQRLRFFLARLHRDEKRIAEMEYEVMQFNSEVEEMCRKLGGPVWTPQLPKARSEETVRIGIHDIPADLSEIFETEIMP